MSLGFFLEWASAVVHAALYLTKYRVYKQNKSA